MEKFVAIICWMPFVALVMWRAAASYFYWRNIQSKAVTPDAVFFSIVQGVIFTGVTIFWFKTSGYKSFETLLPGILFGLAGISCLYFGTRSLIWIKKNMGLSSIISIEKNKKSNKSSDPT